TKKRCRDESSQNNIGISHRRLCSSTSIGRGTRISAGRFRPDAQCSANIEPGDAATASANCVDINHWKLRGIPPDLTICGLGDGAINKRNISRCSANVEGDCTIKARCFSHKCCTNYPCCWT